MKEVKRQEGLNFKVGERVDFLSKEAKEKEEEFYQNNTKAEGVKRLGKDIAQITIDSYKPENLIRSFMTSGMIIACIFLAPLGFVLAIITLYCASNKENTTLKKQAKLTGIIGICISLFMMVATTLLFF